MEYAIVIGHTKLRPGACSPHGIPCEWEFNKLLTEELDDIADIYTYDSYNLGYKSMCKRNADKLNKKDYRFVIELHYNSASPSANGAEGVYYFKNKKTKELSELFAKLMHEKFGMKKRGPKALVNKNDRGFWAVYYPYAPTIILEPFFGSNKNDVNRIKDNTYQYTEVIRDLINKSKDIL